MAKKIIGITLVLMVIGVWSVFADEIISIYDYESASNISIDRSNAQELLWRVNNLLTKLGITSVTVTSGARNWGAPENHPASKAIDLRYNRSLYNSIVRNISGTNLRVECIHCIRVLGQGDHIHLDMGSGLNRAFHTTNCGSSSFLD